MRIPREISNLQSKTYVPPVEYSRLDNIDTRFRSLLRYPWQVVVYRNRINFIVPADILLESKNTKYRKFLKENGISDRTSFCTLEAFINTCGHHPSKWTSEVIEETCKKIGMKTSYDIDGCYHPFALMEKCTFRDFCYEISSTDIQKMLDGYINAARINRGSIPDRAFDHYFSNVLEADEDMWDDEHVRRDFIHTYVWDDANTQQNTSGDATTEQSTKPQRRGEWSETKRAAKSKCSNRFVRGGLYKLRIKGLHNTESLSTTYRCVQVIHAVKNEETMIVVMKAIEEHPIPNHRIYCLDRRDCAKYHIRYEEGLEVFPQNLNWIKVTPPAPIQEFPETPSHVAIEGAALKSWMDEGELTELTSTY